MDAKTDAEAGARLPAPPPEAGAVDPRLGALRRMRLIATLLLVLMAAVFVVTSVIKRDWLWLPYLRAFAEAAMVGACADWFAIVALFRRPFGLPIPHTGIVPNNKDRIGAALGRFITNNFLTEAALNERLARVDLFGSLGKWLSEPANAKRLADYCAVLLPRIVRSLPTQEIGASAGKLAQQALQSIPAAPLASKMLAVLWAQGEAQELLAQAVDCGESWLAANKTFLKQKITRPSSRWIPKWVDRMMADKVLDGMAGTLGEMRDPSHPWRVELKKAVERLIEDLTADPQMREQAETIKAELLTHPLLAEQAKTLWAEIEAGLATDLSAHADAIAQSCEQALQHIGAWLIEDDARRKSLNRRVLAAAEQVLLHYRFEIGAYIERVVHDWDTATLVQRLELQVGKDLQYIRINGTLVGGLVGLLIFVSVKWIPALF